MVENGDEKNVKPSIISNVYQDIRGYEEIDIDDTTTADSDEETNTNHFKCLSRHQGL